MLPKLLNKRYLLLRSHLRVNIHDDLINDQLNRHAVNLLKLEFTRYHQGYFSEKEDGKMVMENVTVKKEETTTIKGEEKEKSESSVNKESKFEKKVIIIMAKKVKMD